MLISSMLEQTEKPSNIIIKDMVEEVIVMVDMPGVIDPKASLGRGKLYIKGERNDVFHEKLNVSCEIDIPVNINPKKYSKIYENGVLTLVFQRKLFRLF